MIEQKQLDWFTILAYLNGNAISKWNWARSTIKADQELINEILLAPCVLKKEIKI